MADNDARDRIVVSRRLEVSRKRYREVFEGSRDGFVMVDATGRIIDANQAFCDMLGYSLAELRAMENFYRFTPERWREWEKDEIWENRLLGKGYSELYEKEYIRKDGTVFPVELRSYAVRGEDGGIDYLWGTVRDITERKQAEETLRRSHEMLARTEQIASIGSWEWDVENDRVRWSRELFRIFGRDPAEGAPSFAEHPNLYVASDMARLRQAVEQCVADGTPYELELRAIRKDGDIRHCVARGQAEVDAEGEIRRLVGSLQDLTDRTRAEMALQESEQRFRSFVENANDLVYALSPEGAFTYVSPNWTDFLGEPAAAAVGKSFEQYVHPEDVPACRAFLKKVLETGKKQSSVEYRVRHQDGTLRWHVSSGSPLSGSDGEIAGYVGIARDVTEQKKQLAHNALLSEMLDTAPAAITLHDTDGCFIFANQETLNMHGYESVEAFKAVNLHDLDVPESEELLAERFQRIAETGEARFEVAHYRKDGTTFPLEVLAKLTQWEGRPVVLSVATDITDRKRAEKERERLLAAIEQAGEMIVITDSEGSIQYVNPAFERVSGYARAEVVGRNPRILKSGKQDKDFYRHMWRTVSGKGVFKGQLVNSRKDGTHFTVETTIAPVHDTSGAIVNYVAVQHDITEQLRMEEQFRQAQKMESVGRLAGGVAHDYNNMLGVILGSAELALERVSPGDPLYSDLKEIHKAAQRSSDITRQLLAFARKQTINPRVLDLNTVVEGMLKMLRHLITEDIDLKWLPASDLWPVKIDPSQVEQILANLCVNARDAIAGIGTLTIETGMVTLDAAYREAHTGFVPGDYVLLVVSDDGCGMDSETCDNIFEPFFTTKDKNQGTGLGLATVYGIVKQNRGFVNVYSEPGKGTTFRIYFPRHMGTAERNLSEIAETIPESKGERVLLVEDEAAIRKMTRMMLERLGYQVLVAGTYEEALQLAESHVGDIHLLVTDVVMPGMNGRDLANRLHGMYPDMKILFMSGYTANVIAHRGVLEDGVNFIQKPFSKKDLGARIRYILEGKK